MERDDGDDSFEVVLRASARFDRARHSSRSEPHTISFAIIES